MKINAKITNLVQDASSYVKAFASVTLDNQFVINGLRIMEGKKGVFIGMPQSQYTDKEGNRKFNDIAYPMTKEVRKDLINSVTEAYYRAIDKTVDTVKEVINDKSDEFDM